MVARSVELKSPNAKRTACVYQLNKISDFHEIDILLNCRNNNNNK